MVLLLVSLVVYVVSFLLMQALSRYREFAADRGAALITGRPSALASALVKISGGMARIPQQDLRAAERAERVLHLPRRRRQGHRRPVRHAPADGEADRGAGAPRVAAAGPGRVASDAHGLPRHPPRQARAQAAGGGPAVRDVDRVREARDGARACTTSGKAAIVFQPLATSDFEGIVRDMEEVVQGTGEETGTRSTSTDDEFGYRWMVLADPDMEDLVVGVNAVSTAIQGGGYGDRVLCAVFAFRDDARQAASTGSTTTSAAGSTRSCPPAGRSSATTSASCA